MDYFLAQCVAVFSDKYPIYISILVGGLIGSLSHCSVMCSPLVAAQMFRLQAERRSAGVLWFYHSGRITTYMVLGTLGMKAKQWLFGGEYTVLSHALLALAGVMFVVSAAMPTRTHACCSTRTRGLQQLLATLRWPSLHHYLRGMLMGLMPCGLLFSVLLMVSTLPSVAQVAMVMLLFGLSTLPVLHGAARAALSVGNRYPRFGLTLGRVMMAANGLLLWGVGLNLVRLN